MTTARTLIKKAMQKVGILVKSEVPDDDEANDALDSLNALIASWSNYSYNITTRVRETFSLPTTTNITIGAGQTFNTTRPIQIVDAYCSQGTIDYPMEIVNAEQYDSISFKSIQGRPQYLSYDNGYPTGNINVYPVSSGGYTLTILSEKAITGFATLDTELNLPQGWERALVYNLALELAPEYGQQPDGSVVKIAADSLGAIRLAVVRSRPVNSDLNLRVSGNIYDGWFQ